MRVQARVNLEKLGYEPTVLDDVLPMQRLAVCTGHMTDAHGRKRKRFPESNVPDVRMRMREVLARERIAIGYASAARGADLLFLDELLTDQTPGAKAHILLPFPAPAFRKESVVGASTAWTRLFDRVTRHARAQLSTMLPEMPEDRGERNQTYLRCHEMLCKQALEAARDWDAEVVLVAVWNRASGDAPGGTADAVSAAQVLGIKRIEILNPMPD